MHLWAAPAYSIGKSKRSASFTKLLQPGPATYHNEKRTHSPSWKMTTASKSNYKTIQTPGPGSYTLATRSNAKQKGVSFKGRPSSALNTYQGPGPGDYKLNMSMVIRNSPSHKIPKDRRDSSKGSSKHLEPGPTTYLTTTGENWKSGYKFGRQDKLGSYCNTNPGPCTYEFAQQELKLKKSVPRASFGSAQRIKSIRPDSPGPGSYFVPREFQGERSVKKGYKIPTSSKDTLTASMKLVPGPGAYDLSVQSIIRASPAYSISGGPIHSTSNYFSTPGPSTYNTVDLDSKIGVSMNKSKKYQSPKNKNSPGPGLYNCSIQFGADAPKYTIPLKTSNKSDTKSPGPGDYTPAYNDSHIYTPIIKREKESLSRWKGFQNPGPGFYNPKQLDSVSYSIGREKRDNYRSEMSPGPGQYDFQSSISNLPRYSLHKSINSKQLN